MDTKKFKQKILDLAIHGKLVPQDPNDEPASVLLERIRAEKERLIKEGKIKKSKKAAASSDTSHYGQVPFEVPQGWEWVTLGEIGTWQAGGTPSRMHKEYYGGNIPWLKTGDLNDGDIIDIPEHITQEGLDNSSAKLNPAGSVLIAMYGATIGKLGILTFPATTNQACCACVDYRGVEKEYLFFFLMANKENFISLGGGGAQPNISKDIIVRTYIPIPPKEEQRRIINAIKSCFNIIDSIENDTTTLKNSILTAKAKILDLAIHGKLVPQDPSDEPASELLKHINPKANITTDNAHYPQLPESWTVCKFEDIVEYEQPTKYIVSSTDYDESYNTPVLTAGKSFIIGRTDEDFGIYNNVPCIIFDDFTTDSKYVDFPFKVKSSAMKILSVKAPINIKYIALFMSVTRLIGDTHKRYWISEYSKIDIALPPLQEQNRIVSFVESIFTKLDSITENL